MIYVISEKTSEFNRFKTRNAVDASFLRQVMGKKAVLAVMRSELASGENRWACFISASLFLPDDYVGRVNRLVEELDCEWPNWGGAAACGRTPFHSGYLGQNIVRYSGSPGAFPNKTSVTLPAMLLEGEVFLLNVDGLRRAGATIPEIDGPNNLDLVLSAAILEAGRGLVVAPGIAAWSPQRNAGVSVGADDSVLDYLAGQIANRSIETSCGMLELGSKERPRYPAKGLNLPIDSLRHACLGRPKRKVAIVTRTRFTRTALLQRVITSVRAFVAAAGQGVHFEHHIISDRKAPQSCQVLDNIHFVEVDAHRDSRFLLVAHAVKSIEADFFWFIDDDDWLFPNAAERLSLTLGSLPVHSLVIVDCQQFNERHLPGVGEGPVSQYVSSPIRRMPAERIFSAMSGLNSTPFCGAIFPRAALLTLPDELVHRQTYLEDYTILLSTLLGNYQVFQCHMLMAGISIRENGNTVTEVDRTAWDQNMARLISHLVNDAPASELISLTDISQSLSALSSQVGAYAEQYNAIINSSSWKWTRPLRIIARIGKRELSLREFIIRTRHALGM